MLLGPGGIAGVALPGFVEGLEGKTVVLARRAHVVSSFTYRAWIASLERGPNSAAVDAQPASSTAIRASGSAARTRSRSVMVRPSPSSMASPSQTG